MRFSNTAEPAEADTPATKSPRKWRRRAGALVASVALLAVPAATVGVGTAAADPTPECSGQAGNCWEYQNWYWTYENCDAAGADKLRGSSRWDNYNCAGDHGLVVWLWMHKK